MNSRILAGALVAAGVLVAMAKDPVIMKVAGVDVPKSEFEYLYHKNSQQQIEPQSLDSYVDMFTIYKLKVADAKAAGVDTTEKFKRELEQYRRELALPYLTDSTYIYSLAREEYERGRNEAEAIHIMIMKSPEPGSDARAKALLDSLRGELKAGADFETLAREYSQDRSVVKNGGNMGYMTVLRLPYRFEKAMYELGEGEISDIVESNFGYHLLKGGKKRPARGTVYAAHIMKMVPPGSAPEVEAKAKAEIDSIYAVVKDAPSKFEGLARTLSDDKGSARNGGILPWFGPGEMVKEFENTAFALADGEISEPVRSQYGWHIIRKIDHKGYPSFEENKDMIIGRITNPQFEQSQMIRKNQIAKLSKKHRAKTNRQLVDEIHSYLMVNGMDSVYFNKFGSGAAGEKVLLTIGKKNFPAKEFFARGRSMYVPEPEKAVEAFDSNLESYTYFNLIQAEEDALEESVPEYRHLLTEYRDGSMLYELSVAKVWDKASQDEEGLNRYFETHRGDYTWQEPRVKGYLVQCLNDSVGALVRERMADVKSDDQLREVKKEFSGKASIDRVLVPKGQNAMIDHLMFDGPKASPQNANYTTYFLIDAVLQEQPQEVADVRGLVISDYQNQLEAEWVEELRAKYPVEIYPKVVKTVK